MRVHITPTWNGPDKGDGGIRRVVEAQIKYLPEFGIGITDDPRAADLVACHGAARIDAPGVPFVCHSHGMLWEDYNFGDWGDGVNAQLIESMVRAQAVTAPSQWVAHAISRGMLVAPTVLYHGVDADDWATADEHLGYVLWNKARVDPVSDPNDMQRLAERLPDVRFLSTYGQPTQNVLITGLGSYEQMKPVVQRAGVYLATTRETFGIGTLEALAAGVPIVGWDYGGQHEIVRHGETGYLAPFGDTDALADCVRRALAERARLSAAAQTDVRERWGWKTAIERYADLYQRVVAEWTQPRPKVSVIVPAYNLAHYLDDAVRSVVRQTINDWELLIVDDCSTDSTQTIAEQRVISDDRIRYLKTPHNLGLSGARNYGWQHAQGKYILFLDADDQLDHNALDLLATALDRDSSIHIAYGSLDTIDHEGNNRRRNPWPAGAFSWHAQIAHLNQLHGSAMMRREVLERSGGYRVRDWRAEDAAFWARVTSFGFRAAKVTEDTIQIYRLHEHQKSKGEPGDGDWTAWLPWRLAGTAQEGVRAIEKHAQPNPRIVPFGAQGAPPTPLKAWSVRHYQHPVVSIVIPVGPGHAAHLIDALDSVQAQTFVEWECIVVNDTGKPLELTSSPWARQIDAGGLGAGGARNRGLEAVSGAFVVFLDADDVLTPRALEEMLKAHVDSNGRYAYSDWLTLADDRRIDGPMDVHEVEEYDPRLMLDGLRHAVTALVPTDWARDVGGFDEQMPAWEDWDFYAKLAVRGYHGVRVPLPLLVYRTSTGTRRNAAKKQEQKLYAVMADRFAPYLSGEEPIMSCCGNGPLTIANTALADLLGFVPEVPDDIPAGLTVRLEYIGEQEGAQSFNGITGKVYRAGRNTHDRYCDADARDVDHLLAKRNLANAPEFRIAPKEPEVRTPETVTAPRVKGRKTS